MRFILILLCFLQFHSAAARAEDLYILSNSGPQKVPYEIYARHILDAALDAGTREYGSYKLQISSIPMQHLPQLHEFLG